MRAAECADIPSDQYFGNESELPQRKDWVMFVSLLAWMLGFVTACVFSLPGMSPTDQRISAALDVLAASPSTAQVPAALADRHVRIWFAPKPLGDYGDYLPMFNGIELDPILKDADPVTLAAVLAHEAVHAQRLGTTCIDEELRAFRASAVFWHERFGAAGKRTRTSEVDEQMNTVSLLQSYNPAALETQIRQTYSHHCAG
jgi:hypothetical protein